MSIGQELVLMVYYDSLKDLVIKDSGVLTESEKNKLKSNFNKYIKEERVSEGIDYLYKGTAKLINEKQKLEIEDINKIELSDEFEKGFLLSPELIIIGLIVVTLAFGLRRRK